MDSIKITMSMKSEFILDILIDNNPIFTQKQTLEDSVFEAVFSNFQDKNIPISRPKFDLVFSKVDLSKSTFSFTIKNVQVNVEAL